MNGTETDRRFGPFRVPRIACGKCGTEHHIDATTLSEQGTCRECSAYLRRPTEAEQREFTDFLEWNMRHSEHEVTA